MRRSLSVTLALLICIVVTSAPTQAQTTTTEIAAHLPLRGCLCAGGHGQSPNPAQVLEGAVG